MSANFDNPDVLGLAAFGKAQALPTEIVALRRKPHEHVKPPAGLLKYADEQAVVAIAALCNAVHDFGLTGTNFTDWGVVASPRFLGREHCAMFLERFYRQGALGTSPLLAVYQSVHAVAGSVTLALGIHGPNMGVGGGNRALEQTLLAGLAMQSEHRLPGVWMVFSEWDPEPTPDDSGKSTTVSVCRALCLAFTPAAVGSQGLRLRLCSANAAPANEGQAEPTVAGLTEFLVGQGKQQHGSWHCPLYGNAGMELTTESQTQALAA